jgi:hypothetical protein
MARRSAERNLSRFTPLLESGTGLKSRSASSGRRVYKGVTIIKAGLGNQRDRNYYPVETLERAVKEGRFEGLRAYADHPDSVSEEIQPERTVRDMVGIYTKPRFVREGRQGGRILADLNLFRSARWLSDTVDDLLDMGQADKIGLSINGRGRTVEKRIQLEEAADPLDVNYVEDFLVLRSGDVVTEAGAGGGFQHLLESARGRGKATEETAMKLNAAQRKAIKEAFAKNDLSALGKLLKECKCSIEQAAVIAKESDTAEGGTKKKVAKTAEADGKKKKAAAAAAEEDAVAEDADGADEEEPEIDHDAELDEAVDDVVGEGDDPDAEDEADDADDSDIDESGEDDDEADDDAEADDDEATDDDAEKTTEAEGRRHPLSSAASRVRQAARETERRAREAGVKKGKPLVMGSKNKGGSIKGPGSGKTAVSIINTRRKQGGGQKGRRFGESAGDDSREVQRLREENARLSSQLRIRTTADRARKLLRESAIPEKLRPEILRLMVGKKEDEMTRIVRYHERLVSTAIEEATYGDLGSGVEGAGARIRESYHGGARDDASDFSSLFDEVGIPTRGDE